MADKVPGYWLKSLTYKTLAMPICRRLFRQTVFWLFALALANAGNSNAARMAMMAMTTKSSIKVKPVAFRKRQDFFILDACQAAKRTLSGIATSTRFGS